MTRIVAGHWRGRPLTVPRTGVRPTSDRVREAVFSRLDHLLVSWEVRTVLDLYAGSGALGLEALSRGAAHATFVDRDRGAAASIRLNAASLGAADRSRVIASSVLTVLGRTQEATFDIVFADPPYDAVAAEIPNVLTELVAGGWLASDAVVVIETGRRYALSWPAGLSGDGDREYGDTMIWYGRRHTTPSGSDKD